MKREKNRVKEKKPPFQILQRRKLRLSSRNILRKMIRELWGYDSALAENNFVLGLA